MVRIPSNARHQQIGYVKITDGIFSNDLSEGHLEVAIHSPRLPFGSLHTEFLEPVFQVDGVYGINTFTTKTTTGVVAGLGVTSGTVSSSSNKLTCSTGTTALSFATLQSRRRLRYRPGQGVVGRFAGYFTTGVASSYQVAGFGTAESGFFFGFNGTSFGILQSTGGVREIHTLTITTASTATNDYVITLPNTNTVTITATNNNSTSRTAWEIAQGTFPGWTAQAQGSTVVFVSGSAGPVSGSFSLAQTGAVTPAAGNDAETLAGVSATDTWIPQASWNGDVLDGTGSEDNPTGATLDVTKGNVYEISIQYLGFGSIEFRIEVAKSDSNPEFITVHTIKYPNTTTTVSMSQPSFPFTMAATSAGSTTNVSVNITSFAGFNEGASISLGPRMSYYNNSGVTSTTNSYTPLFTVYNSLTFASRPNQSVVHLLNVGGAAKSNTGLTTFYLIRNATITGNSTSFSQFATTSTTYWDTGSTGCSFSTNNQVVWSGTVSESGNFNYAFADQEITLQPGEWITLAVRSVTATGTCVGSLNTREDQ